MRILLFLIAVLALPVLRAAEPAPLQFAEIGDLRLLSGDTLRAVRVGYRTYGSLNEQKSNAILFPTWFGGKSADLAQFIGPGAWLDPTKFFIITVDALANGVSTSPSNSTVQPVFQFPPIAIADMVESQRLLIEKTFGISKLHAVVGISMGGMQTFEWAVKHGGQVSRAMPVVGSPRLTAFDKFLWSTQRQVILDALKSGGDARLAEAMRTVRLIHDLHLRTPEWRVRSTPPEGFDAYFAQMLNQTGGLAPLDYVRQLEAMIGQNVLRGQSLDAQARALQPSMLVIVDREDEMVRPEPAVEFARAAGVTLLELRSGCGHLATACAGGTIAASAAAFLQQ
jgi:homoserine O-acetyltransferase/O-succinyltransferase